MASHATRWLGAGALSAAGAVALSWVCCLPILAALLGAGVASFGMHIEPWRPYLLLAGALAVGAALVFGRRPCDGPRCAVPATRRRWFLWGCAAAIAIAAAMPYLFAAWLWLTL